MESISLTETGDAREFELNRETAHALRDAKLVTVKEFSEGRWLLKAAGKVGIARVAGVEVCILPKVPISRLFFMIGYALNPRFWRNEDVTVDEQEELGTAMAYLFERQAGRALKHGVLQGYHTVTETLPVMRGRLREADQLRRRFGLLMPLEVSYDEFSPDIAENQLLLAATDRLLRLPHVHASTQRRLRRISELLSGVTLLPPGKPTPGWQATRPNLRYHKALRLAEIILRSWSAEMGEAAVPVSGFLLTMSTIFQDFVTVALRDALKRHGGTVAFEPELHLDEGGKITLLPDLVWSSAEGSARGVADAKYKIDTPNDDIYQMFAYCTALKLKRGHLIYAKGNGLETTHVIRGAGIEIVQHALDLETPPRELLAQIDRLAGMLVLDTQTILSPVS